MGNRISAPDSYRHNEFRFYSNDYYKIVSRIFGILTPLLPITLWTCIMHNNISNLSQFDILYVILIVIGLFSYTTNRIINLQTRLGESTNIHDIITIDSLFLAALAGNIFAPITLIIFDHNQLLGYITPLIALYCMYRLDCLVRKQIAFYGQKKTIKIDPDPIYLKIKLDTYMNQSDSNYYHDNIHYDLTNYSPEKIKIISQDYNYETVLTSMLIIHTNTIDIYTYSEGKMYNQIHLLNVLKLFNPQYLSEEISNALELKSSTIT